MLGECGLLQLCLAIEDKEDDVSLLILGVVFMLKVSQTPLSLTDAGSPAVVANALSDFAVFLKNVDVIASPRLTLLTAPRLSGIIYQDALQRLCISYGTICEVIKDPHNKYEFAGTLLGRHRPFGQITTLKQLLGLSQDS